jgi:hypothetical protein
MRSALIALCVAPLVMAATVPAQAACHVLASSCAHNGDGSTWGCAASAGAAGALNAIPSSDSLVRGDSYYFAKGSYNVGASTVFSTPNSGTRAITWKAATAADNCTSAGFDASTMVGQTVFGPMEFTTDYWVLDGQYNSNGSADTEPFYPAGCPVANIVTHDDTYKYFTCSASGYGFKIENMTGKQDCSMTTCDAVSTLTDSAALLIQGNDTIVQFVEIEGSNDQTHTTCDHGFKMNYDTAPSGGHDNKISYSWSHDVGEGNYFDATDDLWIDHNWFQRNSGNSSCHGETIGIRGYGPYGTTNLTFSNNFIENGSSTAFWNTPNSGATAYTNIYVFGNVFFCNTGETSTAGDCYAGNGFLYTEMLEGGSISPMVIVNNDFDGAPATGTGVMEIEDGVGKVNYYGTWNHAVVENNIWSNPPDTKRDLGLYCAPPAVMPDLSYAYNAYLGKYALMGEYPDDTCAAQETDSTSTPTFAQLSTSANPYVKAGNNVLGQDDYQLVANTDPGANLGKLSPPNGDIGVDMLGHARTTWSRGALEFCDGGCVSALMSADGSAREGGAANDSGTVSRDDGSGAPGGGSGRDAGMVGAADGSVGNSPGAPGGSGGCGCRAAGQDGQGAGALWGIGFASLLVARRRSAATRGPVAPSSDEGVDSPRGA